MIAVVYGSSTDNTRDAAEAIAAALRERCDAPVNLLDVATLKRDLSPLLRYDTLVLGCPTWNIGELQDDWYDAFPLLERLDWSGKRVALFGCGDQQGYPDSFQDALGIIGRAVRERGATIVGWWPVAGYDFYESLGVEDKHFFGLALDHDNEAQLTAGRIARWVVQLAAELKGEAAHARL